MNALPFIDADHLLSQQRLDRQQQISAEMSRVAKASEASLPIDQRRQVIDCSQLLVVGGTVAHTAGPTWQQRARIAAVLAVGLPVAIGTAYLAARTITALAEWLGALFA